MRPIWLGVLGVLFRAGSVLAGQATFDVKPFPAIGSVPLTVEFTLCDVNDASAEDKKAAVDFGDGQSSVRTCQVAHTYISAGTYQVTLRFKTETATFPVQVVPTGKPIIELSATPNPVSGLEPSTITMKLTDPSGEDMTWTASLEISPPEISGGGLTPASGGPVASGRSATTVYDTAGGLALGTVTVTAINVSGRSNSQAIVIPTCQPGGQVNYPSDSSSAYPIIPVGGSITFTVIVEDCPGVPVTVSASVSNAEGGDQLTLDPHDGVVVGSGTVMVTFRSTQATTATVTIWATDALGATHTFMVQAVGVQ